MSLDSHGNSSSGGSTGQRTGTYDVAMVNQNYQGHDDTAMSTASDYDLGGDYDEKSKKKKKKGLRDVIFKRYVCKLKSCGLFYNIFKQHIF